MFLPMTKPFKAVYVNSLDAYIPEIWAQESVQILLENMVISSLIHRDFSDKVASFGDIVHTRKPAEFTAVRKTNADSVTVQDASATNIPVPLDQHLHTTFIIKDGEESKSFKMLRDEYLQPAVWSLAQALDKILLGETHAFYQNAEGFAAGIVSTNVKEMIIETRKRMNINKAHEAGRNLILSPDTEAEALKLDTFTEADKVGDDGSALREASLGRKFQFNIFMAQNTPSTIGGLEGATNPLVDLVGGYPKGTTVVHVDTAGSNLEVGHWIRFDGVSGGVIHLITALGSLSTEDIDVTIDPPLRTAVLDDDSIAFGADALVNLTGGYAAGYAKEIVVDNITGIVPVGTGVKIATAGSPNVLHPDTYSVLQTTETATDTTGITLNKPLAQLVAEDDELFLTPPARHNFAFHRNCLALVSRPLAPAPAGLALSSVANFNNIGIRVTITYDGDLQGVRVTVDLLCGIKVLDTALGAVLAG